MLKNAGVSDAVARDIIGHDSEANAAKWRHLFDELIEGSVALEVPLEGNGKSICSLRIRISDALKWLADRFRVGAPPWSLTPV